MIKRCFHQLMKIFLVLNVLIQVKGSYDSFYEHLLRLMILGQLVVIINDFIDDFAIDSIIIDSKIVVIDFMMLMMVIMTTTIILTPITSSVIDVIILLLQNYYLNLKEHYQKQSNYFFKVLMKGFQQIHLVNSQKQLLMFLQLKQYVLNLFYALLHCCYQCMQLK